MVCKICVRLSKGLYSCKWKRSVYDEDKQTRTCEYVFLAVLTTIFLFCVVWLYNGSVFKNDADLINFFLYEQIQSWFNWYLLLLIISAAMVTYLFLLFVSGLCRAVQGGQLHLFLCHKIFIFICLTVVIALYIALALFAPNQFLVIVASLGMTSPFLQISAMFIFVFLAWYLAVLLRQLQSGICRVITYITYAIFFIFLFTIPIWLQSPCIGPTIHPKPLLIGHRGAPDKAPENTMLSFQKSVTDCDVVVLESDVRLSSDGIPFLMHDSKLSRTTNVVDVFPDRKNDRAETFSWSELQQLNAGNWYLETDPFLTNGDLTASDRKNISLQKITSLVEYANFAADWNRSIFFNLRGPPLNHINYHDWVNVTVETLLRSRIPQQQVLWLFTPEQDFVRKLAPGFRVVVSNEHTNTSAYEAEFLNLIYSETTEDTIALNYSVISYTVNEVWAFSRAWCQGVWAVTTNKCSSLRAVERPSWKLTGNQYLAVWIPINAACLIAVCCVFIYYHLKTNSAEPEQIMSFDKVISSISGTQETLAPSSSEIELGKIG